MFKREKRFNMIRINSLITILIIRKAILVEIKMAMAQ